MPSGTVSKRMAKCHAAHTRGAVSKLKHQACLQIGGPTDTLCITNISSLKNVTRFILCLTHGIYLLQFFSFTALFTYSNVQVGLHLRRQVLDPSQSDKLGAFYSTVYYVYSSHWAKHRLVRKSNSYRVEREASRTCVEFAKINSLMSSNLPASSGRAD